MQNSIEVDYADYTVHLQNICLSYFFFSPNILFHLSEYKVGVNDFHNFPSCDDENITFKDVPKHYRYCTSGMTHVL